MSSAFYWRDCASGPPAPRPLVLLSSLTSAFKFQFPVASGPNMSVSYGVDITALILGRNMGRLPPSERAAQLRSLNEYLTAGSGPLAGRQLLAFSRRPAVRPRRFALGDIVRSMDTILHRLIGPEIDFEIVCAPEPLIVVVDSGQTQQVVLNLVVNAFDAMPEGGRVTVRVEEVKVDGAAAVALVEGKAARYTRLKVSDTGTGIDEQARAKRFKPFFTTREQGKGTGRSLSIVDGIVKQSGGCITVVSEPGKGATFRIYLPIAAVPEPAAA